MYICRAIYFDLTINLEPTAILGFQKWNLGRPTAPQRFEEIAKSCAPTKTRRHPISSLGADNFDGDWTCRVSLSTAAGRTFAVAAEYQSIFLRNPGRKLSARYRTYTAANDTRPAPFKLKIA